MCHTLPSAQARQKYPAYPLQLTLNLIAWKWEEDDAVGTGRDEPANAGLTFVGVAGYGELVDHCIVDQFHGDAATPVDLPHCSHRIVRDAAEANERGWLAARADVLGDGPADGLPGAFAVVVPAAGAIA